MHMVVFLTFDTKRFDGKSAVRVGQNFCYDRFEMLHIC